MRVLVGLCAALFLTAAAEPAPSPSPTPAPSPSPSPVAETKPKKICKPIVQSTGSRMGATRACKTEEQWKAISQAEVDLSRAPNRSVRSTDED
jgi:hypothetical protein